MAADDVPDPVRRADGESGAEAALNLGSRAEDSRGGFDSQARIFAAIGTFLTVVSVGYGLLSQEWAGTTMLALASALAFTVGGYVGWTRPVQVHAEVPESDEPWFPASSGWPFALAVAIVLVANGLLLGLWLLLPAAAFLAYAIGGFVHQSRTRG